MSTQSGSITAFPFSTHEQSLERMAGSVKGIVAHETSEIKSSDASTAPTPHASSSAVGLVQEAPVQSWKSYIWDTFDKSPEERRFLFKLDAVLMTLASLGYFIKYLDQVSVLY
jgi:hypothetical protein